MACLLLCAVALLASAPVVPADAPADRVLVARPPKPIQDFQLTDQNGKPLRLSQLKGQPLLLFFGFTHCPDACPRSLGQMLAVSQSRDPALRGVRFVMISNDGERDTPAVMKKYLAGISPDFIGLTGPPKQVQAIANQFSAVFFKGFALDQGGNYLVEHTTNIYLLDRQGRLRATFFNAPVDAMVKATAAVAREKS
jgi:protein SCO1/2